MTNNENKTALTEEQFIKIFTEFSGVDIKDLSFKSTKITSYEFIFNFSNYLIKQSQSALGERDKVIKQMEEETFSSCPYYHKYLESQSQLSQQKELVERLSETIRKQARELLDTEANFNNKFSEWENQRKTIEDLHEVIFKCFGAGFSDSKILEEKIKELKHHSASRKIKENSKLDYEITTLKQEIEALENANLANIDKIHSQREEIEALKKENEFFKNNYRA